MSIIKTNNKEPLVEKFIFNFKNLITDIKFWLIVLFFNFLSYGYYLNNRMIFTDDFDAKRFYDEKSMLKMGRVTSWFFDYILDLIHYNLFFLNALALSLMILNGLLLSSIIKTISNKINNIQLALITTIFTVFSMSYYMQIFNLAILPLALGYTLLIFMILYTLKFLESNKLKDLLVVILIGTFLMSTYESLMFIYIQFFLFLIVLIYSNHTAITKINLKKYLLIVIFIFLSSIIIESLMSKIILIVFSLEKSNYTGEMIAWFDGEPIIQKLSILFSHIIINYYLVATVLKSTLTFIIMTLTSLCIVILLGIKSKKRNVILLSGFLSYLSIFSISMVTSVVQLERSSQGLIFFMALSFWLLFSYVNSSKLAGKYNKIVIGILSVFCLWNAQEVSEAHDWDTRRYENEINMLNQVNTDISRTGKPKKIYVNGVYETNSRLDQGYKNISYNSRVGKLIYDIDYKFGEKKYIKSNKYMKRLYISGLYINKIYKPEKLVNYLGNDYSFCKLSHYELKNEFSKLKVYPENGYFKEYKGCTIIRLGERIQLSKAN